MPTSQGAAAPEQLPYWQVNMSLSQRPAHCPEFLLHVSDKDRGILSTRDEDYRRSTWDEVKDIVARNDLASFRRLPSDLRRYLEFKSAIEKRYGSMLHFVQQERLQWPTVEPSGDAPFNKPTDYKILWNDWPYGIDTDITHLVVWTKFVFEVDPITGDITPSVRSAIEAFVRQQFCDPEQGGLDRSQVIWFKNWSSLRSVDAIEHCHVMLHQARRELVDKITNGDRPLAEKVEASNVSISDMVIYRGWFA
ncbi:hypothetical protein LTR85_004727 [Meristemomyces frigidus]|nr:hypothetical protein LTR85_004727 [Meristemomyces frigidus]